MRERILDIQCQVDKCFTPYYGSLPAIINERGYKTGIEIGVYAGGHSKAILENTEVKKLIGVDPYLAYDGVGSITEQEEFDIMMELALARLDLTRFKHLRMTSDEAYLKLQKQRFDFVFIDGLHTVDQLQRDLDNYSRLIRKGGVVSFHDIDHPALPWLTPVMEEFAKKHEVEIHRGIMHFAYVEKSW